MKKILLLIISLTSFILFTNNVYAYDNIVHGDYEISIEKITLEYYDEDGYFYEGESGFDIFYSSDNIIDLTNEKTINPVIVEDTWYMNGDFPVTLIDLNIDISDFEIRLRENLPTGKDQLIVGIFVEYKYVNVPSTIKSTYPINYIEVLYNSFAGMFGEETSPITRLSSGETTKVPLAIGMYEDGDIQIYDNLRELKELDSAEILLNYDIQSTTDSETYQDSTGGEFVYIHTMDDVDVMKTVLEDMYKPRIYVSYYTDTEIDLEISTSDSNATTCELYRSTSKAGGYKLIATNNCDDSFTDEDVESDRTYYYKVKDNNGKVSEITTVSTDPEYEDPVDDDSPSYDDYFDDDETPTEPTTTQKKDSGTVENKDTGIHSFIIIGVAAIVVAIIILKFNKNSMKTKL